MASEGEPADLLAAYKAALDAAATPPCAPLLKLLENSAENDIPIATLNLKEAGLGAAGAATLAAVLQRDSFMTYANLEENDLGDDGTAHVANALCNHQSVFRLDLGYNKASRASPRPMMASPEPPRPGHPADKLIDLPHRCRPR